MERPDRGQRRGFTCTVGAEGLLAPACFCEAEDQEQTLPRPPALEGNMIWMTKTL